MKNRVLITNNIPGDAYDLLRKKHAVTWNKRQLTEAQLIRKAGPFQAILSTLADPVTEAVLRAAPRLKVVANCAVGFNNVDLKAAKAQGIRVTNTPEVLTDATADLTWALILSCARRVPEGERLLRSGMFKGAHPLMLRGLDLWGKTLGVYGFGRIGKAVAYRGRGWDMKVVYHQRHREKPGVEGRLNAKYVSFEGLLRKSDFLCVTAPLTPETRGRFTLREFRKMKRTAVFINTGRGPIHNERDLGLAVGKGIITSAGLDVYEREPRVDPGLLGKDWVTLLPHIGSATVQTRARMALLAAKNIDLVLSGRRPLTPVI